MKMANLVYISIFLVILPATLGLHLEASSNFCQIPIRPIKDEFPVVYNDEGIVSPALNNADRSWWIKIPADNKPFTIFCPGQESQLTYFSKSFLEAQCTPNGDIQTEYGKVAAERLVCSPRAAETVTRNGTCVDGKYSKYLIYFPGEPAPFIEGCFNEAGSETIYAKHTLNGPKLDEGVSTSRPDFQEGLFFPEIDADSCYKTAAQIQTIAELLGSQALADQYVQPSKQLFLSRGHMVPNGDGIPAQEKKATFYFINCTPQWQTINGGNWNELEIKLRSYASQKQAVLTVWTGALGVTTLRDINKKDTKIYLGKTSQGVLLEQLPVPRILYKVIVNEASSSGVVVVQINNPYPENHTPEDILCEDICNQISWVTWDVGSAQKGKTYCCDVASFSEVIPGVLPELGNLSLLK